MCDVHKFLTKPHWKGWVSTPSQKPLPAAVGPWLDLTWPLSEDTPRLPYFGAPEIKRFRAIDEGAGANLSTLSLISHVGTHVDAPVHFVNDAPSFQDIPLSRLTGQGVVWHLDLPEYAIIEPEHFAQARPVLQEGDFLILDADWARRAGDPSYHRHPYLSLAAAEWLVEQRIALLGVDWTSPDAPDEKRGENYLFPAHRTLLANGVLIAENLTNVSALRGKRAEFVFGALNIANGDGSPARILARPIAVG